MSDTTTAEQLLNSRQQQKKYFITRSFDACQKYSEKDQIKTPVMDIQNTQSQMRKGVLEFCILSIIRQGEVYPSDIVDKMKAANLQILEGTLYPLLTRLKNDGLLTYRWVESNSGPPRKYFLMTDKGLEFYGALEKTWNELADAVHALTAQPADTETDNLNQ